MPSRSDHAARVGRARSRREIWWPPVRRQETPGRILSFCLTATVVGAVTGLVARAFAVCLEALAHGRTSLLGRAQQAGWAGLVGCVVVAALGAAAASALVRRIEPHAEGSGIPRVEAIVEGTMEPGSPAILPVKFVGGLLAMGAGLALGREGPSVQMGASVATTIARLGRRNRHDLRLLVAAGAAAGLATAFNAPIAGGVFVLEELLRRFDTRATLATLLASGAGFVTSQLAFGRTSTLFDFPVLGGPRTAHLPVVMLVGLACGLVAVAYNVLLIWAVRRADRMRLPREAWAALLGAVVGVIGFLSPVLVGGGDVLTQRALGGEAGGLLVVTGILVLRLVLSVASYTAATPGGIFAPMLVLGTHVGLVVGLACQALVPDLTPPLPLLALVGMAAFFAASVQAPVTGIVLAAELTSATGQLPPMLGGAAAALLVALALRSHPVYAALTLRAARAARRNVGWREPQE